MKLKDYDIFQGRTFYEVIRYGTTPLLYTPIQSISKSSPCVIAATGHNIPDGWPIAVVGVTGMREINANGNPPKDADYRPVTVIDDDTLAINSLSSELFAPYVSGGAVVCHTPVDLTGYVARMMIKNKVGGTILAELTTENGGIEIDANSYAISLSISDDVTEGFTWKKGVYDLELEAPDGTVKVLLSGLVFVTKEVTV